MDSTEDFSPYRSDGKLYGFVCVVTGASQPVGQAIIAELAAHGAASIYACDKTITTSSIPASTSTTIIPYPSTLTSEDETLSLIDEALNAYGRLDIWVCSSGLLGPPSIHDTTPADMQACFAAQSLAPFWALKHAPPAMGKLVEKKGAYPNAVEKRQRYGSLIVVGSVASGHAALGVVRAGVAVLKGTGVRINCISAGQIDVGVDLHGMDMRGMSDQFPPARLQDKDTKETIIGLERAGRPQEVARVAGFLASGFSSYVTGANLVVDGGASTMNPMTIPI
ncbi:hypothetical protein B0T16DRAFT_433944 [Cercophora newfieldiana]|uniref:Peroxisomal trans-2-enoyl-CoA reductase n=1 Tax=Cercophora newfieldiana TaxID=92897 RepID=A0AA40D211_9PEZI|nr:hypothetical protein B0T16DRAFT_433944 [Cercophora newfieldiana]